MEIERKFTIKALPNDYKQFPFLLIEQAYLNTDPVVRVRQEGDRFFLTYKGKGMLAREEYNFDINEEAYLHLRSKADGNVITKTRYLIPLKNPKFKADGPKPPDDYLLTIELDVFNPPFSPLVLAEVEFGSREAAEAFIPPDWFSEDVTYSAEYHNSNLSKLELPIQTTHL